VDSEGTTLTGRDRYLGAMLGLAAGDALGTTLEFTKPGRFTPITDMVGGGPFHLEPGEWTDDTSMALCLAESLHGADSIPNGWRTKLARLDVLESFARRLHEAAQVFAS
jgi:ADP-ribosylglycohydrolase